MLNEKQKILVEMILAEPLASPEDFAKRLGVTRQTIWKWKKSGEVQAEVDKRLQDISRTALQHLGAQTTELMKELLDMAHNPRVENRVRANVLQYLLDRQLGRTHETVDLSVRDAEPSDALEDFKKFLDDYDKKKGEEDQCLKPETPAS